MFTTQHESVQHRLPTPHCCLWNGQTLVVMPQPRKNHRLGDQQTTPKCASPLIPLFEAVIEALVREISDCGMDRRLFERDAKLFHRIRPTENLMPGSSGHL